MRNSANVKISFVRTLKRTSKEVSPRSQKESKERRHDITFCVEVFLKSV